MSLPQRPFRCRVIPFYDQEYGKLGISEQEYLSYVAVADCDWDGMEELLVIYSTIPPYDAVSTFLTYDSRYEIWDVQENKCTLTQQKNLKEWLEIGEEINFLSILMVEKVAYWKK